MPRRMMLVGGLAALVGLMLSLPAQARSDAQRSESLQSYIVVLSPDVPSAAAVAEEHAQ